MNRQIKFTALLVTAVLLLSMLPAVALSGNVSHTDSIVTPPVHDVSVMSFNILDYDTHNTGYALPSTRATYVISTISNYMPDLIGIQEAADAKSANNYFDWNQYLSTQLGELGYDCRQLTQESVHPGSMTIGAGLMIFWKRDRFTMHDHGSARYANIFYTDSNRNTKMDVSRYYQYVKLFDRQYGTYLYMFNTHFSISPTSGLLSSEYQKAGDSYRTEEARQLSAKMMELAENMPVFATGDYNCRYSTSNEEAPDSYNGLLYRMSYQTPFEDSAKAARRSVPSDYTSILDHCFVNTHYTTVIERRVVYDDTNGYQPSDHRAVMTYADYTAAATFHTGAYNAYEKTFTDQSGSPTYTFDITPSSDKVSYTIVNEAGQTVSNPVTLTKRTNRFTIRFYAPSASGGDNHAAGQTDTIYNTVRATITYTAGSDMPAEITAPEAVNAYFTNGAYYVALDRDTESIRPTVKGGTLYQDEACKQPQRDAVTPASGKSVYYVKIGGKVYPLYICKESAAAQSGWYYADAALEGVRGVGAYCDRDGVILVDVGRNGFGTIGAAVAAAPSNSTICVAPAEYTEEVSTDKALTLLGNNRDVSPIAHKSENEWQLSDKRLEETILRGTLLFTGSSGQTTVHGFTFTGSSGYGPLRFSSTSTGRLITLDVANNIFSANASNTSNGSQLHLNSGVQKAGRVENNYFAVSRYGDCASLRAVTLRNANGLTFEGNYFKTFDTPIYASSETAHQVNTAGHLNLSFRYNRFENCGNSTAPIKNVYGGTSAHVQYLYNDFIRCGQAKATAALTFNFNESKGYPTDYAACGIKIFGNRFINCYSGVTFTRNAEMQGDARNMSIIVQHNRFIEPNQYRAAGTITVNVLAGPDNTVGLSCPNWMMNYNYMRSTVIGSVDPSYYINRNVTVNDSSKIGTSFVTTPYYTDQAMTMLSSGGAATLTGVSVQASSFPYDGTAKQLILNVPDGSLVSYSTDGIQYTTVPPTQTEVGAQTVHYQVEKAGYAPYVGTVQLRVTNADITGVTFSGSTVVYDGAPHALRLLGTQAGDSVTYTYNGSTFTEPPAFTDVGDYQISATVRRANHNQITLFAKLTIRPAEITGVTVRDYTGAYDGANHVPVLSGTREGDTVEYAVNGGAFSTDTPVIEHVGEYTVRIRVSRTGHEALTLTARIVITPAALQGLTVGAYTGPASGLQIPMTGTQAGDTVLYSLNGKSFSAVLPVFDGAGFYTLWLKISRPDHVDALFLVPITITDRGAPFVLTLQQNDGSFVLTGDGAFRFGAEDIRVLQIGVDYADAADTLFSDPAGTDMRAQSEIGLTRVDKRYELKAPAGAAFAAAFIVYEWNGVRYKQYSAALL